MKLFDWIFDDKKEVLDTTKVVDNKKEVYVVKPHKRVTRGGFPWEQDMKIYNRKMMIPENQVIATNSQRFFNRNYVQ